MEELVFLKNNEAVCDSLQVAEKFHKTHNHIMRDISNLSKNGEIKERKMFWKSHYRDSKGRTYGKYYMNRDGFSLLVMGFNGEDAIHWKLEYIEAFDKMESIIREKSTQAWIETRQIGKVTRRAETDTLKRLVEYAKEQGSVHSDMLYMTYTKLVNQTVGVKNRDEATTAQLNNISLSEHIILHEVDNGIVTGKYYKEIYQDCKNKLDEFKNLTCLESFLKDSEGKISK